MEHSCLTEDFRIYLKTVILAKYWHGVKVFSIMKSICGKIGKIFVETPYILQELWPFLGFFS